jgi:hypothetical protein
MPDGAEFPFSYKVPQTRSLSLSSLRLQLSTSLGLLQDEVAPKLGDPKHKEQKS